jgi:hypothetical protein
MKKNRKLSLKKVNIATINEQLKGGINEASVYPFSLCICYISINDMLCRTKRNESMVVVNGVCHNDDACR